jgi:predicted ribosome quality control (RQC) complex YloA/Tae2 family protein
MAQAATTQQAIRALRSEVDDVLGRTAPQRQQPGKKQQAAASAPYRRVRLPSGDEVLVGLSARGNATVTFDLGRPYDFWLHTHQIPGAHVILRVQANEPTPQVIEQAAALAAWHSPARDSHLVEVDVTPRRHVRKIAGAHPGLVTYSHERTIRVRPADVAPPPREPGQDA